MKGLDVNGTTVAFTQYDNTAFQAKLWTATVGQAGSAAYAVEISATYDQPYGLAFNRSAANLTFVTTATDGTNFQPYVCTKSPSWFCGAYGSPLSGIPGFDPLYVAGYPYWTALYTGNVSASGPSGDVNIATGETYPQSLIDDGTYIYWETNSTILRLAHPNLSGTSFAVPTTVASGLTLFGNSYTNSIGGKGTIATDGKYVYFGGTSGPNTGIFYVPVGGGGTPVELTPVAGPLRILSVNVTSGGQAIVFADLYGIGGNAPGVYKVAPPP
jgi:hypothetical protein